jgi:hypothetical protein
VDWALDRYFASARRVEDSVDLTSALQRAEALIRIESGIERYGAKNPRGAASRPGEIFNDVAELRHALHNLPFPHRPVVSPQIDSAEAARVNDTVWTAIEVYRRDKKDDPLHASNVFWTELDSLSRSLEQGERRLL